MKIITFLRDKADALGLALGQEPTDWDDVYHTCSDEELEAMAKYEEELQSRKPLSYDF